MAKSRFFDFPRIIINLEDEDESNNKNNENEKIIKKYKNSKLKRKFHEVIVEEIPICPICLDKCKDQCNPNKCLHSFCYTCICEWGAKTPTCPLCKVEFCSVSNRQKTLFKQFSKKQSEEDEDDNDNEIEGNYYYYYDDEVEEEEEDESENENELNNSDYLDFCSGACGYELDGFVVDDDFLEYESS